jgi:transposase-like protein
MRTVARHVTHKTRMHGLKLKCHLCKSTDHITHGVWQGREVPLCKLCKSAIGVAKRGSNKTFSSKKQMSDAEYERYMKSVYAEREAKEKKRAEGEAHMNKLVAKMKQDYFKVEDEMQERSKKTVGKPAKKNSSGTQKMLW